MFEYLTQDIGTKVFDCVDHKKKKKKKKKMENS